MTPSARLTMFPLGSVLVPHATVTLHIFEPRYRVLVFDCLRADREFGVVLIERGFEVGGHDQRFSVGTVAAIGDAVELPDGRWVLQAVGRRRIVVREWLPDDPYPVALVHELVDEPWSEAADEAMSDALRAVGRARALAAGLPDVAALSPEQQPLGGQPLGRQPLEGQPPRPFGGDDDPATAAWHLLAGAPLGPFDKQSLLAGNDPAERLRRLAALAEEQSILLAYRLDQE